MKTDFLMKHTCLLLFLFVFSATNLFSATTPSVSVSMDIEQPDCKPDSKGAIDYEVGVEGGWLAGYKVNDLRIINENGQVIYTHSSKFAQVPTGSVANVPVGIYFVKGSVTVKNSAGNYVTVRLDETVKYYVGYQMAWAQSTGYLFTPNAYSLERNTNTTPDFAKATAQNIIQLGEEGWLKFNAEILPSNQITSTPTNYLILSYFTYASGLQTPPPNLSSDYISFGKYGSGYKLLWYDGTTLSNMAVANDEEIVLEFTTTSIKINVAGTIVGSINRPSTPMSAHFYSDNPGTGFDNIISSFPCKRACAERYPKSTDPSAFSGLYDEQGQLIEVCPGPNNFSFSVASFANYAHWTASSGTLSCTDCLNPDYTNNGTAATITVQIFEDPSYLIDPRSAVVCKTYTFSIEEGECPVEPCSAGDLITSNGTNPVQYSPCDAPQMSFNSGYYYSWSPQIGLSCYDCSNPTLLIADIMANNIPQSYQVSVYHTELDRTLDRPCQLLTVNMLKKFCAEDCVFELDILSNSLQNPCEGDVVVLDASGEGSFVWNSSLGGLNCEACEQTFYTVQHGTTEITLMVFNEEEEQCGEETISITSLTDCFTTTGVSYNNYGVNSNVQSNTSETTFLNIYGNIINEIIVDESNQLVKGTFTNTGEIWVSRDWINNGLNGMFTNFMSDGVNVLMGNYQKIRGNSPTKFHTLKLFGQGKKEQFIDAYAYGTLNLTLNELSTRDNIFYMENTNYAAITRTSGFVSSNLEDGGLSRAMVAPVSGEMYLFPLGSSLGTLRYRPLGVTILQQNATRWLTSRLVNYNPLYDNLVDLAPDVESVNDRFYHQLIPSHPTEEHGLLFHYNDVVDGTFQHIAQYEAAITPNYWQKTGDIFLGPAFPGYNPNNQFVATLWDYFDSKNFSLANAGFVIDWEDFGGGTIGNGNGGDTGVTVTVSGPSGSSDDDFDTPFTPGEGEDGTSVVFTPSPLAGTYTIDIDGGECMIDGQIIFDVNTAGNVVPESIYFLSNGVQMPLGESLYELESTSQFNNTGLFDLNAIPEASFAECTNDINIQLSNGIALVAGSAFTVDVPSGTDLQLEEIVIKNNTGVIANVTGSNAWLSQVSDPPGLYKYELHLLNTTNSATITLKGQFILTN